MPGERSIEKQQYYAHPGNQFWKLLSHVFEQPFPESYPQREQLVIENGLALWNVLAQCHRNGSSDNNIRDARPNDFRWLKATFPHIRNVVFESKGAAAFFKRYVGEDFGWDFLTLPSASGLFARMSFEEKLLEWKTLRPLTHAHQ